MLTHNHANTLRSRFFPVSSYLFSTYIFHHERFADPDGKKNKSAIPTVALLPPFDFSVHQGPWISTLSCLSAHQCYLSITKPSSVLPWPRDCINPLSVIQSFITLLSIMSSPSSAHLSPTAHAQKWSTSTAPLASCRGQGQQPSSRKLKTNVKKKKKNWRREKRQRRLQPVLPSLSVPACVLLKAFSSFHFMLISCYVCFLVICLFSSPANSSQWEMCQWRER